MGILDLQLMPLPYPGNETELFETLNMRLTRYQTKDTPTGAALNPREVLRALCTYLLDGEDCGHVKEVRHVLLNGDSAADSHSHEEAEQDYYIVDNFEITFE